MHRRSQQRLLVGIAKSRQPSTGAVQVTKFTIGVDCGKIINPRQLDRCMKSGVVMVSAKRSRKKSPLTRAR